ncbi:hypothetical protein KR009_002780, partial [Drosophila setifemur]
FTVIVSMLRFMFALLSCIFTCLLLKEGEAKSLADAQDLSNSIGNTIQESAAEYLQSHADLMKSYMNKSVEPCDDFYEYACGNWPKVRPNRFNLGKQSALSQLIYTMSNVTEQLLGRTQLAEALNVSSELLVAQRFYNACLGAELHKFPAADPAYIALIRSVGGFPAVDGANWNASSFSWFNMSAHLTNYGASGLIHEELSPIYPFQANFKLPELGFDHKLYTENIDKNTSRAIKSNEDRMRSYLRAYKVPEDKIQDVIEGVFAFWRDVLKIIDEFHKEKFNCMMISAINKVSPFPQWSSYYEIVWKGVNITREKFCDFYYVELDKVCARHPEAVANYLAMKLLYSMDAKLSAPEHQRDYCLWTLQSTMAFLFNKLYMTDYLKEEKRSQASAIVHEQRLSLRQTLEEAKWLDAETRQQALLKESTIRTFLGGTKDDARTERLVREIADLDIVEDNYAATNINLQRLGTSIRRFSSRHFSELSNDTKPQILLVGMQAQAIYFVLDNSINVMAGLLESPAYHSSWPTALKFGTLGYVIGHELNHGFDAWGAMFDSNGKESNWWTDKSRSEFEDRVQCYIDHYESYLIPEVNRRLDGKLTIDENLADNGGLLQAFAAYRRHIKKQLEDPDQEMTNERLPGLDLSPEQLFFLGFAQFFCSDFAEEHYWDRLTDVHTPDKYRVLGALSNNGDFAQAYNCTRGSGMLKSKTCPLW